MALPQSSPIDLIELVEHDTAIVSWINNALDQTNDGIGSPSKELTGLDEQITQLLASLDIACEDTSSRLEHIIEEVSRSVPRVAYDLHFMKDSAITLQTSVARVLEQAKDAVPDTTTVVLDHLRQLATIKGCMEAAREALREAESWGSLESEVTSFLGERSYAKAAERLSEASRNMVVFQNTPEYESRRNLMVNLQNQLEASLSSALVAAINVQDVVVCQDYFSIFSQIQRESEFRNYYNASRRTAIVNLWHDASLLDCDTSAIRSAPPSQRFAEFLPMFYNSFLSVLQVEVSSIPSIFPDPVSTLSVFISSTLSSLQPSFSQRLSSLSDYYGETALKHLLTILNTTEEFAGDIEKLFEKIGRSVSDDPSHGVSQHAKARSLARRSTRLSISWRPGTQGMSSTPAKFVLPDMMEWSQELFQPFFDFQIDYGMEERNLLGYALRQITTRVTNEKVQDGDLARLLRERTAAVISAAEESLPRCDAFTYGYGSMGLVQALDSFFKSFIEGWATDIRLEVDTRSPNITSGDDLSDMDYTAQDWSDFQLLIHLLSSARVVFERIATFETKLHSHLAQTATRFRLSRNDPAIFRRGSQLLEQSPLNSADLHVLLGNVGTDVQFHEMSLSSSRHPLSLLTHEPPEPLLTEARRAVFTFAASCQISLQSTILAPLRKHLASYTSSPLWNEAGVSKSRQTQSLSELQVPSFSLSPSESIQRVAEGLLNLPRLFEIYADDDALAFSLHTLANVDLESLKYLAGQTLSEVLPQATHMRRTSLSALPKPAPTDPGIVSSAWLASLGHGLLLHFTTNILPRIPPLSMGGIAQLTSDIEYLENIVHAINVDFPELKRWKENLELSEEDGKRRLSEVDEGDHVVQVVARLRGWEK